MRILGLTGGVATGKSTSVSLFKELDSSVRVFDADRCVAALYLDTRVLRSLADIAGAEVLNANGSLDKDYLRGRIFAEEGLKSQIQNLVHPLVRKECLASLDLASKNKRTSSFIADVPLLFEGGFDFGQDANLVVAVSRKTQVQRLIMRNGFDDATVHAILAAQLPISHKEKCADVVLWNEGHMSVLKAQIKRFIENNYQ